MLSKVENIFSFFPICPWSLLPFEEAESPNSAHVTLLETSAPFSFCDLAGTGKEQRTEVNKPPTFCIELFKCAKFHFQYSDERINFLPVIAKWRDQAAQYEGHW